MLDTLSIFPIKFSSNKCGLHSFTNDAAKHFKVSPFVFFKLFLGFEYFSFNFQIVTFHF